MSSNTYQSSLDRQETSILTILTVSGSCRISWSRKKQDLRVTQQSDTQRLPYRLYMENQPHGFRGIHHECFKIIKNKRSEIPIFRVSPISHFSFSDLQKAPGFIKNPKPLSLPIFLYHFCNLFL